VLSERHERVTMPFLSLAEVTGEMRERERVRDWSARVARSDIVPADCTVEYHQHEGRNQREHFYVFYERFYASTFSSLVHAKERASELDHRRGCI
jgi:hypothetical protein